MFCVYIKSYFFQRHPISDSSIMQATKIVSRILYILFTITVFCSPVFAQKKERLKILITGCYNHFEIQNTDDTDAQFDVIMDSAKKMKSVSFKLIPHENIPELATAKPKTRTDWIKLASKMNIDGILEADVKYITLNYKSYLFVTSTIFSINANQTIAEWTIQKQINDRPRFRPFLIQSLKKCLQHQVVHGNVIKVIIGSGKGDVALDKGSDDGVRLGMIFYFYRKIDGKVVYTGTAYVWRTFKTGESDAYLPGNNFFVNEGDHYISIGIKDSVNDDGHRRINKN